MDVTKPLKFKRFGAKCVTKYYKFIKLGEREGRMTGCFKGREGERDRTRGPEAPKEGREDRRNQGKRERGRERERERQTDLFRSHFCSRH